MKTSIYTTLLIAFIFTVQPSLSQNKKYKDFYKSVNKAHHNAKMIKSGNTENSDVILETVTPAELDSLMKNMVGVTDIMVGGKSILHPVITLELDPASSASEALFGEVETLERSPMVGRAYLEPKITGIATVKRKAEETTVATTTSPISKEPTKVVSDKVNEPVKSFDNLTEGDWKLFRAVDISLMNQTDQAFLKKYSIVLGTFKSLNNADFIKRTFNSMGEHSIVVQNSVGRYYALLGSFDTEAEAVQALDNVTKKYTEGISKTRRISRFGIPLDDMWILITK
ncbi:SPOR domain-containing protein [Dysgonomonas sp. Marseille-P4677]|uniref:SPOR domain-containing protein n=1 Tax=Dysgonomonas sp. Marseille-P4677 TaxID=2364790 RepID=UPI001911E4FB|nr:SPOR domain-containing protein [Dysgonomonas sp. Marseille-P4677]MBK5721782.1 SPOR domain-containing protein [Dysgonomonas sp. Marseille-P4677]